MLSLVIGSDHAGFALKQGLMAHLKAEHVRFQDVGCFDLNSVDYPSIAALVVQAMQHQQADMPEETVRGIIVCGSGLGVCMSANRFPAARAAVLYDHGSAEMSRRHNDSNIACFGGRIVAEARAIELLGVWLSTPFDGGRHQNRVNLMDNLIPPVILANAGIQSPVTP